MIALTLVVGAFAVSRLRRTYQHQQVRTAYVRTERQVREYAIGVLRAEHELLKELALAERGRIQRDAVALLMQAICLGEQAGTRQLWAPGEGGRRSLEQLKANFEKVQAGQPVRFPTGRSFLRGYYAAVDDTFQPYSVCLPKDYTEQRAYPLIITLHDRMGPARFQCRDAPYYEAAISVKPEGRGDSDYMHLAEDDVLAVLEEVCQLYNVDRSRVYLVGQAMGATGCWHLAAHYPHLFSGVVAIDGSTDPAAWTQHQSAIAHTQARQQVLRAFLRASLSPVSYAENLEHCHIVAAHTARAGVVPVAHTRSMVERLRGLKYSPQYLEFPQAPPESLSNWIRQYAVGSVFGQRAARPPGHIRYKTAHLRHNRAWWLRVDRLDSPVRFSMAEAEARDGRVDITTDNVCALTVLPDQVPGGVRTVRVDGTDFPLPEEAAEGEFRVEKWQGQWRISQASGLLKRKGLSGPFSDVFRDPFLLVYGTAGGSDTRQEMTRAEAERFQAQWKKHHGGIRAMKSDAEVSDEDIANFNLVLLGGPAVNEVSQKVAPGLPIKFEEGAFALEDRRFAEEDMGLFICYPNPLNPQRMVAMVAGNTAAALYQAYDRTGLWFNWGIYSKYKWFDYAVFDGKTIGPDTFRAVGFFDNEWRYAPRGGGPAGGGAERGRDPAAADRLVRQGFPYLKSAADSKATDVSLSNVRPITIDQFRGAVGFDRSYAGTVIRLGEKTFKWGLGVKPPSTLSFALDREFRRFSATVGLSRRPESDTWPPRAEEEVVFEVWGDGRLLGASPPLNWREPASSWTHMVLQIPRVNVLTLKAQPVGGQTWVASTCAWADPTVTR